MTIFLYSRGIRLFDYPRFAEPLRERIRERAQHVCQAAGVQIEHCQQEAISARRTWLPVCWLRV